MSRPAPPPEPPNGGSATSSSIRRTLSPTAVAAALSDGALGAFQAVCQQSQECDLSVYLVGGPVRDGLLGVPILDLDFSVEGDAVGLARLIAKRIGGHLTVHPRFGTATVALASIRVDLVTARRESYRGPGQLPDVTPGTIGEDLSRRDFTINAMAMPLLLEDAGLLDPMGGLNDLEGGMVRVLHPLSFADDPTRMFRAVRYEQRFGFLIDEETLELMDSAISSGHMNAVSADRWRHELDRILDEEDPGPALLRAAERGLLAGLQPAWRDCPGLQRLGAMKSDVRERDDWLAALFSHLSVEDGEAVINRLRLSGHVADLARDTMLLRDAEADVSKAAPRPSELYRALSVLDPAAVACRAKLACDPSLARVLQRYLDELRFVKPVLTGEGLLAMGVPQGPLVGRMLERIREARLDGFVASEEEERALAHKLLAQHQETGVK